MWRGYGSDDTVCMYVCNVMVSYPHKTKDDIKFHFSQTDRDSLFNGFLTHFCTIYWNWKSCMIISGIISAD